MVRIRCKLQCYVVWNGIATQLSKYYNRSQRIGCTFVYTSEWPDPHETVVSSEALALI